MRPYERFQAWQACHELVLSLYRLTHAWPRDEMYGLTSQVRRAGVSAASNIAEGSAKRGVREFRRYLDVSLGSLSEVSYILRLARDMGLITPDASSELDRLREKASKLTWGLYERVSRNT